MNSFSEYHSNLVSAVKGCRDIAPETLAEMVRTARAKAGGIATAQKRRECAHEAFNEGRCTACGQKGPVARMSELRYFVELDKDGLTDWMQITPGPGKWSHPKWGTVAITPETLQEYVDNFKQHVYQEHIPVDAEHRTKLSGALAYYRDMAARPDGLYAKLELTERGKELLDAGGFKYFSPEFYDEWQDPATGKTHKNVITGGAFTTRPFFKDAHLKPIQLSELEEAEEGFGEEPEEPEEFANPTGINQYTKAGAVLKGTKAGDKVHIQRTYKGQRHNSVGTVTANNGKTATVSYKHKGQTHNYQVGGGLNMVGTTIKKLSEAACAAHSKTFCEVCGPEAGELQTKELATVIAELVYDGLSDDQIVKAVAATAAYTRALQEAYAMGEDDSGVDGGPEPLEHNPTTEGQMNDQNSAPGGDDLTKQFAETQTRNTALEIEVKAFQEQNKALTERVSAMEAESRQRQFAEIVTGRGGANDGGPQWFGDASQHVKMLESLHTAFGSESEEFKAYVESQNAVAKAMAESVAMQPIGKASASPSMGSGSVDGKLRAYAEQNKLSVEVATLKYFAEHPEEYAEWDRAHTKAARKGA